MTIKNMWDLISQINWSEGFYKIAFFIVAIVLAYSIYHGTMFFSKRFITIFESLQASIKQLTDLASKTDTRITLIEQEQKFQNDMIIKHDKQFDRVMDSILKASSK